VTKPKVVEDQAGIRFNLPMASLKSTIRQIWLRTFAAIGITAAIVVAWWMKVEDARMPDTPPQVTFGKPVNVGRAVFTPQKLTVEKGPPSTTARSQAGRALVLTGRLENVTSTSQAAILGPAEKLPALSSGGTDFPPPMIYLVRDRELLKQLEPRISEDVAIVWDLPADWRAQNVTIEFSAQQFKLRDNLYAKASWLLFYPAGTLNARPEPGA
jgi:hypothetical protein